MADEDLDPLGDIIAKFPLPIPRGPIDVEDEDHFFRDDDDMYFIRKAPVISVSSVTGTLDGAEDHEFTLGVDYEVVDDDGDGEDDSIHWLSGDTPDDETYFYVNYRCESVISRYIGVHDTNVDGIEDDINEVIRAAHVSRADAEDLQKIAALFGSVGERGGREADQYRQFIQAIVQVFKGRGTKPGIRGAIAAAIGVDESDVTIIEDFDNTGYEIEFDSSVDTSAIGQVVNDIAELADPSGVSLLAEPVFTLDGATIDITTTDLTVTDESTGLGGGTMTLDGTSSLGPGETSLVDATDVTASPITVTPSTTP